MLKRFGFTLLAATLLLTACHRSDDSKANAPGHLTVDGSAFVLTTPDGQILRGRELEGATVYLAIEGARIAPVTLASITPDPDAPDLLRHEFRVPDGAGGSRPACKPNAYGETWGFPVALPPGHPGRENEITITCASGAVGKCARFGYRPWAKDSNGESLLPLHAACVHMVRADYCGDGVAHTKDGTQIDIFDDRGIQTSTSGDDPAFAFEAGWTPRGAACVDHTRWPDLLTLEQLQAQCPRLKQATACDANSARALGAKLFDRSRPKAVIAR